MVAPKARAAKNPLIKDEPISSDSDEDSEESSSNDFEHTTLSHTKVTDKSVEEKKET